MSVDRAQPLGILLQDHLLVCLCQVQLCEPLPISKCCTYAQVLAVGTDLLIGMESHRL